MGRATEPRGLVDEHLSLTAGALRDAWALEGSSVVRVSDETGVTYQVRTRSLSDGWLELRHKIGGSPQTETIEFEWVELRFGDRPFLICPDTGARCARLYFRDGRFASRAAHGLAYRSQVQDERERAAAKASRLASQLEGDDAKGAARGGRRERLVATLQSTTGRLIDAGETPTELVALLEREAERVRRPRRRLRPRRGDSPMLMRSALHAGRGVGVKLASRQVHELLDREWLQHIEASAFVARRPGNRDEFPELDVRRILPKRGLGSGHQLLWPLERMRDGLRVLARVRICESSGPRLELWCEEHQSGAVRSQALSVSGAGRERFLICPINGSRHRKLYYRAGLFASAQAHRLVRVR